MKALSAMFNELSASHRAVLVLANIHFVDKVPYDLRAIFADVVPKNLVRIAQSNHIHPLVGRALERHPDLKDALPRDLTLYFMEMYRANQERLEWSREQLAQIDQAFADSGISGIVMKGGGDVLDPLHGDPAIRFSGDLDILVQKSHSETAEKLLLGLGAQSLRQKVLASDNKVNWRGMKIPEHHLPKIVHPNWFLPVEIHVSAGQGLIDKLLPVPDLFERKVATDHIALSVMSAEDRGCHLIAHANHHKGEVDLRAWIDWAMLRKICDRETVAERLATKGLANQFAVFERMVDHLEGSVSDQRDDVWCDPLVRAPLLNFGDTRSRRRSYFFNLAKSKLGALLKSPEYRRYVVRNLVKPNWWQQVWKTHKIKRYNQR